MADQKVAVLKPKSPVWVALDQLDDDPGALYAPAVLDQLRQMRQDNPADFARTRQRVKESRMLAMAEFDRLTAPQNEAGTAGDGIFDEVEPWPDPVDGAQLLRDIVAALQRHVIADRATLEAAALWVVFTWATDAVQVAPIANITAPEKRCGKTILLSAIGKLAYRPLQASDIASAALFRSIELWSPTLLIDEVDAFLRDNEEARGILNAGFTRDSAFVIRCVGDDHIPTRFRVWGAKALCGIGKIADTLTDRSIPLQLRRKKPGERVERLRHSDPALWEQLRQRITRFIDDNAAGIARCRPVLIDGLNDRANDCWEPLLQIAEVAGGDWPAIARRAALTLHGVEQEAPSIGVELLADVKAIFDQKSTTKLFSADLLLALTEDEEAPWATWNRGKPMSARQLSAKLGEFGIRSGTIRQGFDTRKGFSLDQFRDAFDRYLSGVTPVTSVTSSHPSNDAGSSDSRSVTHGAAVTDGKRLKPSNGAGCDDVTLETPPLPGMDAEEFDL